MKGRLRRGGVDSPPPSSTRAGWGGEDGTSMIVVPYVEQRRGGSIPSSGMGRVHPPPRPPPPPTESSSWSSWEGARRSNLGVSSRPIENDGVARRRRSRREREASAIREHLERHESLDDNGTSSSSYSSAYGHRQELPPAPDAATSSSSSSPPPPPTPSYRDDAQRIPGDLVTRLPSTSTSASSSSWSVERHPLSLSRYMREFHQISLLATGSFGSVYRAMHKLEMKHYAVKRVTFTTCGYYAKSLSLVMREVRILAKLDHPNCVRYYTSWLEPSWMTGDNDNDGNGSNNNNIDNDDGGGGSGRAAPIEDFHVVERDRGYYKRGEYAAHRHRAAVVVDDEGGGGPRLLADVERAIDGLHDADEIDMSVERRLEAILYGGGLDDEDDGFDWTDASRRDATTDDGDDMYDHRHLPSHRTKGTRQFAHSRGCDMGGDGSDSEASEWTRDFVDDGNGSNSERDSYHNSRANLERGSLQLASVADDNDRPCRWNGRLPHPPSASVTYKYQISLYIQMQLCNPRTLADYISHRNGSCVDFDEGVRRQRARLAIEIFGQIVSGLSHVHAKGIIHRDLKPANIFTGDDGTFMIGDFGLSKMILDTNDHRIPDFDPHSNAIILPGRYDNGGEHTVGVGTASYASPEQTTSKVYGPAADVYSLGLILLELFSNFTSEHERAKAFHDCRHGRELAPWIKRDHPETSALILACTQTDWTRRPSAGDIQASGLFHDKIRNGVVENYWAELMTLRMETARKDRLIQSQAKQIKEKDDMIEDLRRRLAYASMYKTKSPDDPANFPDSGSDGSSDDDY
ncbi:hypothetical protein ACHAXA_008826 [Cyclostephanos tholiformis]